MYNVKIRWIGCFVAAILMISASACVDDDNGNGNGSGFSSSIDGNKKLNTLSTQEQSTFDKEANAYAWTSISMNQTKAILCSPSTKQLDEMFRESIQNMTSDEELQTLCINTRKSCNDSVTLDVDNEYAAVPDNCTATVAELEACVTSQTTNIARTFESITHCENWTLTAFRNGEIKDPDFSLPESCTHFESKCPGYFD